jgi:hypothetical protein
MKSKPLPKDRYEKFLYRFEEYTDPGTCSYDPDYDQCYTVTPATHKLRLRKIGIIKETEKGWWLDMSGTRYYSDKTMEVENFIGQKYEVRVMFVLKGEGKRYAYNNIEDAAESFRIRKDKHLAHLERQIDRVNTALGLLEKGSDYWDN